ncbi:hypothetical protein ABC977_14295 [Thioalkalicoccus limnaeus]|uniref:Fumarate reductase subunit C n=1 Tax=Thioalkalicoccus limnaeus TaxID=120681 RepID=A0ABV4BGD0_9GAMM
MSARRPYIRPMPRTWWLRNRVFRRYMLREATALFIGGYGLVLLWGLSALRRGEGAWLAYLDALSHPLALAFHTLALAMALYHTATWFALTPKLMPSRIGNRPIPARWVKAAHYGLFALCSLVILLLAAGWP